MKKLILIYSLFILALCACESNTERKIPIAILTPVTHLSLEQIEKGFIETIERDSPGTYQFITYNAQGNKTLMRSEVEEIVSKNYALVLTIGTTSSQMMAEVTTKKGVKIPLVFTCVNDPVGFQIIISEQFPGAYITGVKELLDFKEELNCLLKFKPHLKTVMLVFNPMEPGLEKDHQEIRRILKEQEIDLITVEIFQTNELMTKIPPFMDQADAVVILKDNTVVPGLDLLVKLCNRHQIPLMASDLDSPERGAAFGYGVHEIEFGVEAAKKALQVLKNHIPPGEIPVTAASQFILKINSEAARKQGIDPVFLDSTRGLFYDVSNH